MESRSFLIQRYCEGNWPMINGSLPLFVTGPNFFKFTTKESLAKYGEYKISPSLIRDINESCGGREDSFSRWCTAFFLLSERIVQAYWSSRSRLDEKAKGDAVIDALAAEIPKNQLIGKSVSDYLCGLSSIEYYKTYLSEDQEHVQFVAFEPPVQ